METSSSFTTGVRCPTCGAEHHIPVEHRHYAVIVGKNPGLFRGSDFVRESNTDGVVGASAKSFDTRDAAVRYFTRALRSGLVVRASTTLVRHTVLAGESFHGETAVEPYDEEARWYSVTCAREPGVYSEDETHEMTSSMLGVGYSKSVRHKSRSAAILHFRTEVAAGTVIKETGSPVGTVLTEEDFPGLM